MILVQLRYFRGFAAVLMYLNVPPTYASVQVIRLRDKIFCVSKEDDTKRAFVSHLASLLNVLNVSLKADSNKKRKGTETF